MDYKIALLTDFSNEEKRSAFNCLSTAQKAYIEAKPKNKAEQSLCARILLAKLLCNGQEEFHKILSNFSFKSDKRPFLIGREGQFISISHSENAVAVAYSDFPVGIDIQKNKEINPKLINRVLTNQEKQYVLNNGKDNFFKLWTAKEAIIKTGECSFLKAIATSFVRENKILTPDNFHLIQENFMDYTLSVIEKIK